MCLDAVQMDALRSQNCERLPQEIPDKEPRFTNFMFIASVESFVRDFRFAVDVFSGLKEKQKQSEARRLRGETKTSINRPKRAFFCPISVTLRQLKNCLFARERERRENLFESHQLCIVMIALNCVCLGGGGDVKSKEEFLWTKQKSFVLCLWGFSLL
jgi:hypothetical protein